MKHYHMDDMKGGWFIGNFTPSAHQANFEVCYKVHPKGEQWPAHYHAECYEINYVIRGEMMINRTLMSKGDIFVIEPFEVAIPEFLSDVELIVVKTTSNPDDKYEVPSPKTSL